MSTATVIGSQWGDEGKGKIVDFLAQNASCVARFNGGANAGHTVVFRGKTFKFHLIPSGVFQKNITLVFGNGMVLEPSVLREEILFARRVNPSARICISDRAHIVMPYHKAVDAAREKGEENLGTTVRGIGPAYAEKINRLQALRISDLASPDLKEKLTWIVEQKKAELKNYGITADVKYARRVFEDLTKTAKVISLHVCDTSEVVNTLIDKGKEVLLEGAQGTLLDVDHGTFPYVTSSNATVGGACTGLGIPASKINEVIGVVKAYTTRVGEGPFPTELLDEAGEHLQTVGNEFGATTGRPRRCGWLDLPMLAYSHRLNGFTSLVITKLDVLTGLAKIKVCTGYTTGGKKTAFTTLLDKMEKLKPIYREFSGWQSFPNDEQIKKEGLKALPKTTQDYLAFIEDYLKVPIKIVSYGPDRKQTLTIS